jgi:putative restriction endonuclease
MIEDGELPSNDLKLTPELAFRFSQFGTIVVHRRSQRLDIRLPFYHLSSDKVWEPFTRDDTRAHDPRSTYYVKLNHVFYELLQSSAFRTSARVALIKSYFLPAEQVALANLVNLSTDELERTLLIEECDEASVEKVRNIRFRLDIVAAYNYTCALTGYRVTTIDGATIVDAAHIHQFSDSRNDDPRNGIALCKNAHWMFDQGLWSIDKDYRVLVADSAFDEETRDQKSLRDFQGMQIALPSNPKLWPDAKHLAWHRKNRFIDY